MNDKNRDIKKYDSIAYMYKLNKDAQERVNEEYKNRDKMFFPKKRKNVSYKNHPVLD